jgi:hypothetical protein
MPIALAAFKLRTNSNFVGAWIGNAGLPALENAIDILRGAPKQTASVGPVRSEPAKAEGPHTRRPFLSEALSTVPTASHDSLTVSRKA